MRAFLLTVVALSVLVALTIPAASAAPVVRDCGNYGFPKGHHGDKPIFTDKPIVGAGVEDIRVRVIGCRRGRHMVKAFWNDGFNCNADGTRCTFGSFRCRNRRLGEELWLMRCFASNDRMLKFRFGS